MGKVSQNSVYLLLTLTVLLLLPVQNKSQQNATEDGGSVSDSDQGNMATTTDGKGEEEEEMTTMTATTQAPPLNLCVGVQHRSEFSFTCCQGQMFPAGVNLDERWQECYRPPGLVSTADLVHDTLWSFFICLTGDIFKDGVTLNQFAEKYTESYPPEIKNEILKRVEEKSIPPASVLHKERAIRHFYHHIEREVCQNRTVEDPQDVLTSCRDGSYVYEEQVHARGGCCDNKPTPLALEFLRRPPTEKIRACTHKVARSFLHDETFYLGLDYFESDAQQLCHTACTLNVLGLTKEEFDRPQRVYSLKEVEEGMNSYEFDPQMVFDRLTAVLPEDWKKSANPEFQPPRNFTLGVREVLKEFGTRIWETEYDRQVQYAYVEPLFIMCESYNIVVRKLESLLYADCCKEETSCSFL